MTFPIKEEKSLYLNFILIKHSKSSSNFTWQAHTSYSIIWQFLRVLVFMKLISRTCWTSPTVIISCDRVSQNVWSSYIWFTGSYNGKIITKTKEGQIQTGIVHTALNSKGLNFPTVFGTRKLNLDKPILVRETQEDHCGSGWK